MRRETFFTIVFCSVRLVYDYKKACLSKIQVVSKKYMYVFTEKKKKFAPIHEPYGAFSQWKNIISESSLQRVLITKNGSTRKRFFFILQNLLLVPISLSITITKDSFGEKSFSH